MANAEVRGIRDERPRDWQTAWYISGIEWRPGITLMYGFHGEEPLSPARDAMADALDASGFEVAGGGWSDCGLAWAMFVVGEKEAIGEALGAQPIPAGHHLESGPAFGPHILDRDLYEKAEPLSEKDRQYVNYRFGRSGA